MKALLLHLNLTRPGRSEGEAASGRQGYLRLASRRSFGCFLCVLGVSAIYLGFSRAAPCFAPGNAGAPPSAPNVQELMRAAARNQLSSMRHPAHRYKYVHREITLEGEQTTVEIETPQGMVARTIKVEGKPPSEKLCHRNLARLARIAASPRLQRSRLKEQQEEMSRREQLFVALPQAFIFQYDGAEQGTGLIRVKYRPNPEFHPRNRVGGVLTGLAGTMWVDPSTQHLVKIDGQVIKTVSFGWGILAKLYPGGRYLMEQEKLPNGDWRLTMLNVRLRGVILLVKKLNVKMKEIYSSFQEMPAGLTLPEAVKMLDRVPVHCGQ